MVLRDIFAKNIDRSMNPVIKVSDQDDEQTILQELEEYVVTEDIKGDFETLYKNITEGLSENKDDIGVWISGDFGSGKSHFLKIVSFLLKNQEICGKKATEYLKEKVSVPTYSMMKALGKRNIDTILFDIDSKCKSQKGPDAVVDVFMLVFNEMLGLSTDFSVATLERQLISIGMYDSFKDKFSEVSKQPWESKRNVPQLNRSSISKALQACGAYPDKSEADQISKELGNKPHVSSEDFAKMVGDYCRSQGDKYTLFFMADEVGQFISGDGPMMVRLQSIVEDLGVHAKGQAWVIVTSQEDIDAISRNVSSNDFSKIQGRFTTRIKMLSTDVKEVIEKRVLEKKTDAADALKVYYEGAESDIRNKLALDNTMDVRLYDNSNEFAATYPFIPYQYQMLQSMLTQLRVRSLSGKSFSNAARSMLKIFKDTASKYGDSDSDVIVPLYGFFDAIVPELDQPTRIVFNRAEKETPSLQPFDLDVLKTLFLVKYYDGLTTNITNISALMMSSFNESRLDLKDRIKESLERLEQQNFIQRISDTYVYLTNQEQDINNEIKKESVEKTKVMQQISEIAYGNILDLNSSKYSYEKNHPFSINRSVDDVFAGNVNSYELSVRISTPHDTIPESSMAISSQNSVIFRLKDDKEVFNAFIEYLRTKNFIIKKRTESLQPSYKAVINAREADLPKLLEHAEALLATELQNATVYMNGDLLDISENVSPAKRMYESLNKLIEAVYYNMKYVRGDRTVKNIEDLFKTATLIPFDEATSDISGAVKDLTEHLDRCNKSNITVLVKDIIDKFIKKPYGFREIDAQWIMALMFRHGKVDLFKDGTVYKGHDLNTSLVKPLLLTSRNYDRIKVLVRESITPVQIYKAKAIYDAILRKTLQSDELSLVNSVNDYSGDMISAIDLYLTNYEKVPEYPGKAEFIKIKELLKSAHTLKSPEFYKFTDEHEDELRSIPSKYAELTGFFEPDCKRKEIFDRALTVRDAYRLNRNYLTANDAKLCDRIEELIKPENSSIFHSVIEVCNELSGHIDSSIKTFRDDKLVDLNGLVKEYTDKLIADSALLESMIEESHRAEVSIQSSTSIIEINQAYEGFIFKADSIAKKLKPTIPESEPSSGVTGSAEPKPEPSPTPVDTLVPIHSLSIKEKRVSSDSDIDDILEELRNKMKYQLTKGPFKILW